MLFQRPIFLSECHPKAIFPYFVFGLTCLIFWKSILEFSSFLDPSDHNLPRGEFQHLCLIQPPYNESKIEIVENITQEEATERVKGVLRGGRWWPTHCQPIWRVAVIVPYRDRLNQMGQFLNHMHNFLQYQELNYSLYIVEQLDEEKFNRASLLNIGYLEAKKEGPWDCFAFHDIDKLAEDRRNLYHCFHQPQHLTVALSQFNYKLIYSTFFGGGNLMTDDQIKRVNGFSNRYWGWGGEDDDMYYRVVDSGMTLWRYPPEIARYRMYSHKPSALNTWRTELVQVNRGRYLKDGLNTLQYMVSNITHEPLFTHIHAYILSRDDGMGSSTPHFKKGNTTIL